MKDQSLVNVHNIRIRYYKEHHKREIKARSKIVWIVIGILYVIAIVLLWIFGDSE